MILITKTSDGVCVYVCVCVFERLRINEGLLLSHDNELRAMTPDDGFGAGGYGSRGGGKNDHYRSSKGGRERRGRGGERSDDGRRAARRSMRAAAHRGVPSFPVRVWCRKLP